MIAPTGGPRRRNAAPSVGEQNRRRCGWGLFDPELQLVKPAETDEDLILCHGSPSGEIDVILKERVIRRQ